MGIVYRHSLLLVLLVLSSTSSRAQQSDFHQNILTVPVISEGTAAYRAEFALIPNTDPFELELVATRAVQLSLSLSTATLRDGILKIPEVDFNGEIYWLEMTEGGNSIFTVSDWGLTSALEFDHSAAYFAPNWQRLNGSAYDIGVGANGEVWVIGTDPEPGGFGIYNIGGARGFSVEGGALRIDVDPDGNPWIINNDDKIYRRVNGDWQRLPGEALDVGIGADGSVWVASYEGIYRWDGQRWIDFGGSGSRIDVGPNGRPWVVGFSEEIYTLIEGRWQRLPGSAGDIGVGANGSVWVVAPGESQFDDPDERRDIYRWNGNTWDRVSGDGYDISVGPDGMPWVTNYFADIYRGI